MDSEKDTKATLAEILGEIGDVGASGLIGLLALKYWNSFQKLLTAANEVRRRGQEEAEKFASRTSVVIARPMWFVILPTILIASVLSTMLASQSPDHGYWFGGSIALKLSALAAGVWMYVMARKVRAVDYEHAEMKKVEDGTAEEQQKVANKHFGRPWLILPMVFIGFVVQVMTMAAIVVDATCAADTVSWFITMFIAVCAGVMGWIIIRYVRIVAATVVVIVNMGIDLVGGTWSGFILQLLAIAVPGLTRKNVLPLLGFTEEEQEVVKQRIREESRRPFFFFNGVYSILVIWFITFHEVLALGIEIAIIVVLLACLFGWVDLTREINLKIFKRIVLTAIVLGAVMFFVRLIDAAVGPNAAEISADLEHVPVLFYHRVGWLLGALFGWDLPDLSLGCFVAGVPRAGLLLVGFIAVVLGWLASRNEGRRGKALFLVAALVGLPVAGIAIARAMTPDGALCATAVPADDEHDETGGGTDGNSPSADLNASPPERETSWALTHAAGSHPPDHVCSFVSDAHTSVCPGRSSR